MTVVTADAQPFAAATPALPMPADHSSECVSRRWLLFWAAVVSVAYALLWSPWWYPLSDSSLYLSLGRALAEGRGFTYMGQPHRLVPPVTPLFFAAVMRLGGGIGALQAALI